MIKVDALLDESSNFKAHVAHLGHLCNSECNHSHVYYALVPSQVSIVNVAEAQEEETRSYGAIEREPSSNKFSNVWAKTKSDNRHDSVVAKKSQR